VVLATAHPAKFAETVEPIVGKVPVPASLAEVMQKEPLSSEIPADYAALRECL
jgi:threonine synthase